MNVAFRVDASPVIGTGHFVRCFALAEELKSRGASVLFLSRYLDEKFHRWLNNRGIELSLLKKGGMIQRPESYDSWLGVSWDQDASEVSEVLKNRSPIYSIDWLIVDHYAIDWKWEERVSPSVKKIMVIDDLANRPHKTDLLLDQTRFENGCDDYQHLLPKSCHCLFGPRYALLRNEFREFSLRNKENEEGIDRIFVSFGGVDMFNQTEKVLEAFESLDLKMDVVIGNLNPHGEQLKKRYAKKENIIFHTGVEKIARLMARADLAISSAGTLALEECAVGLPLLIIVVAENQRKGAETLAKKGVLIHLGWHERVNKNDIINKFNELNEKHEVLHELSKSAKQYVDGLGASRVANILFRFVKLPLAPQGFRFELIDGGERHTASILKWRNDEKLNRHFIDRRVLTETDQSQFLKDYFLKERFDFILVAEKEGDKKGLPVGVFGIKNIRSQPEIGQLIGETSYLGRGLGLAATEALVRFAFGDLGLERVYARVNEKNASNLGLLKKLNFSVVKQERVNDENYLLHEIRREDDRRWL